MVMITRILIPVEDLLFEEEIREFLVQLSTLAIKLKVLHVIDANEVVLQWPSAEYQRESVALVRTICENLKNYFPGVDVVSFVREGIVKDEIAKEAESFQADLILMGSHGRRGLGKFLLGSTAKDVIPLSPCSVVLLRTKKPSVKKAKVAEASAAQKD
jgi:nucleotide-binding universal stress UspA family protein